MNSEPRATVERCMAWRTAVSKLLAYQQAIPAALAQEAREAGWLYDARPWLPDGAEGRYLTQQDVDRSLGSTFS